MPTPATPAPATPLQLQMPEMGASRLGVQPGVDPSAQTASGGFSTAGTTVNGLPDEVWKDFLNGVTLKSIQWDQFKHNERMLDKSLEYNSKTNFYNILGNVGSQFIAWAGASYAKHVEGKTIREVEKTRADAVTNISGNEVRMAEIGSNVASRINSDNNRTEREVTEARERFRNERYRDYLASRERMHGADLAFREDYNNFGTPALPG